MTNSVFYGLFEVLVLPSFEAKRINQLMSTGEEVLYVIFMDLHKAYDTLDRDRFLEG